MSTTLPLSSPAIPDPFDPAFKDNYADSLINGILAAQNATVRAQATYDIRAVENTTYNLIYDSRTALDIRRIGIKTDAGTCTAALKIDGTNVGGMGAISATSTYQTIDATTAKAVAEGADVTLVITSATGVENLLVTLWADKTGAGAA